jgi:hypothetical protein
MLPPCIVRVTNKRYGVVIGERRIGTHYGSVREAVKVRDTHIKKNYSRLGAAELRKLIFGAAE